eukprot:TRINITY_DN3301_c0_g1_i2.p1 TRINITY_DN3301_c0_g1~~TRINITY_DN3301_c0_g1_i2.p1  ORF type:complete len:143 (-),score=17.79 TRINITY_DN3301_c0_g1_i2:103-531(-)
MNQCLDLLNEGAWLHFFPEGKINQTGSFHPFRYGSARMIVEADRHPIVIPFYISGLDKVMSESRKIFFLPSLFQDIKIYFGTPMDFSDVLEQHMKQCADESLTNDPRIARRMRRIRWVSCLRTISQKIENEMIALKACHTKT